MSLFALPEKKVFFTKNDPDDLRLGDVVVAQSNWETVTNQLVIVGYSDDRGIQANGGRVGAKEGPLGIRQILYKLVAPETFKNQISDIGDFSNQKDLSSDQETVIHVLDTLNEKKNKILSLGGGHDWAFCDVSSFISRELKNKKRPLVINIDAHLDVRSDANGVNSGTPFFKALEKFPKQFDLVQIGIQPYCNSRKHIEYAKKHGVKIFMKDVVDSRGVHMIMEEIHKTYTGQPIFLSLDIDAISATEAPGCSQSWPGGLSFLSVKMILESLKKMSTWNHMGIYEVSPPLDVQRITQKSAALAAYEFLSQRVGDWKIAGGS
jgi:formiminoglutamase